MEFELIKKIIIDVLDADEDDVTMEASFVDDLGADSIDIFQIIMNIEEELDIEVNTDLAEDIKTVGEAVELIKETIGN